MVAHCLWRKFLPTSYSSDVFLYCLWWVCHRSDTWPVKRTYCLSWVIKHLNTSFTYRSPFTASTLLLLPLWAYQSSGKGLLNNILLFVISRLIRKKKTYPLFSVVPNIQQKTCKLVYFSAGCLVGSCEREKLNQSTEWTHLYLTQILAQLKKPPS